MKLGLRWRILLTLAPLLLILGGVGIAGVSMLRHLGGRIDLILRENYRSVLYMERLNEAVERIDSSFQFALGGLEPRARSQYQANWEQFDEQLRLERDNVTLPGEKDLVERLAKLRQHYRRQGDAFFERPPASAERRSDYFGALPDHGGLLAVFEEIKAASGQIRHINQQNMEQASRAAQSAATASITWFGVGLTVSVLLALWLAWRTARTILEPIQAVTESALAISGGNLDQIVPAESNDELGQLAQAFNAMTHRLRDYRDSNLAKLMRAQRTSQATIDSFPDAVLVIDAEGEVEMANPAARRLLGVVPKQSGQPAAGIWQPPELLRQPLADALEGQRDYLPESFDRTLLIGPAGRERALLPRILTIRDAADHTVGAAVLLQDVTRLRLLDQVKSNLVATASHELKTPLTSIRLAVHLLLEEVTGPLTPKQMELLLDARDSSERLVTTVNNLLDLARLEEGDRQLEIQPAAPASLLRSAAEAVLAQARDKRIDVEVEASDELPQVSVDAARIGHALRNLLDNALTYTDAGGHIRLAALRDGDSVVLRITDTGSGIAPEHLPHLFDKFFRVPGQSRGSGTGLGLAIVREIVSAHGGTIACESQPGTGTTFRIRLPIAMPAMVPT